MMKSTDRWEVNRILGKIETLHQKIKNIERFKEMKMSAEIYCESKYFQFNEGISEEIFNVILKALYSQKEQLIKELAELGVEYVE